jgi:hypothetical protein
MPALAVNFVRVAQECVVRAVEFALSNAYLGQASSRHLQRMPLPHRASR